MSESIKIKTHNPEEVVKQINLLISNHLPKIYSYNKLIRYTKYYLKPIHMVVKKKPDGGKTKYYYYGRYWYKLEYGNNGSRKLKWIYVGKNKPSEDLPEPPDNPLDGLVLKISDGEVEIVASRREIYQLIYRVLASSQYPLESVQAP